MTLRDFRSTIFSRGSEDGPTPSGSPDGKAQSGPAPVPASRFRLRESDRAKQMPATFGLFGDASSPSAVLQRSLANRLRARLDVNGSPEYALTWKEWDMPSGPPICALRASARRTFGNGFGGWPTPKSTDSHGNKPHGQGGAGTSHNSGLGDTKHNGSPSERQFRNAKAERGMHQSEGSGGGLGDTNYNRRQKPSLLRPWGFGARGAGSVDCADGKARRVESGIFPLASRVPNRVGTLRGAGNAIVPQVAAEFVMAFMEVQR